MLSSQNRRWRHPSIILPIRQSRSSLLLNSVLILIAIKESCSWLLLSHLLDIVILLSIITYSIIVIWLLLTDILIPLLLVLLLLLLLLSGVLSKGCFLCSQHLSLVDLLKHLIFISKVIIADFIVIHLLSPLSCDSRYPITRVDLWQEWWLTWGLINTVDGILLPKHLCLTIIQSSIVSRDVDITMGHTIESF